MIHRGSIVADKVAQSSGPVHRAAHDAPGQAGPSSPGPVELPAESPGPVELPAEDIEANASQRPFQPPPYSSPSTSSLEPRARNANPRGPQYYPGLPVLDYRQYSPPMFELSADTASISTKATYLSENAKALSALVRQLATVPPKPQVLVQGLRGRKVDFRVRLNLMNLLVPDDARRRLDYLRCVNADEAAYRGGNEIALKPDVVDGVEAWCERFVRDPAPVKTFVLERVVANLDTAWLEGQIRSLVAATEYKGVVSVQFPMTHTRVVVQNPDKVNKFFTSVTTLFSGKARYEVVKAVWPFANARNGEQGRRCVVQSEKTWWEEWRDPIKYAISTKRQGWVTNEDKLECIMESKGKGVSMIDWGPEDSEW
ncbi:Uu.00g049450.m01.CDS01 [Anthostomella pinea]|uniref:Uu.00g049450.m01.CDS01 n=1 Tax=Anthostomella pinea TaxID=933095 RepID=A0AAI8VCM6_9PEZI|nr:Uu.00g049450.m01.CDS01 [Anthostomella pinea]